jgi:hypothetical protein
VSNCAKAEFDKRVALPAKARPPDCFMNARRVIDFS